MSLDLYIECGKCGHDSFDRNITHNVTAMWRKAGVYEALYESHGQRCGDFIDTLERGLEHMLDNFSEYKALDAPNGWGRAEHAIAFLYYTLKECRHNPDGIFRVSR